MKRLTRPLRDPNWLLTLVEEEFERQGIDLSTDQAQEAFSETLRDVVIDAGKSLLKTLRKPARQMLRSTDRARRAFERRLYRRWRTALDDLDMLVITSQEAGEELNRRERPRAVEQRDMVFEALVRLHARACLVAREVICLLRAGFASGAHARWRTLHEIAVVSIFLKEHDDETAERYLLHEGVQSYRAMSQYVEYQERLQLDPATPDEIQAVKERFEALCGRFGSSYGHEYGWAAHALDIPKPTFRDIEASVQLDHLRPYYRLASHGVHAGPKAVYFNIGVPRRYKELLLAGPSDTGLADPGHGCAISLLQVTAALLTHKPTSEDLVVARALEVLVEEIGTKMMAAHEPLEASQSK